MTDNTNLLLDILQEECTDVVQVLSKIRRTGLTGTDASPDSGLTNLEVLESEIGDIYLLVTILMDRGILSMENVEKHIVKKSDTLMAYAEQNK